MVNLGNASHFPGNPKPFGKVGTREPVFPTDPVPSVTIFSGNQFQGGEPRQPAAGRQRGEVKRTTDAAWTTVPMAFATAIGNNKTIGGNRPHVATGTSSGSTWSLRTTITTQRSSATADMLSLTTGDETAAQSSPFTFTIETPDFGASWVLPALLNVGIHAHVLPNGLVLMWGRRDTPRVPGSRSRSPLGPGLPTAPPATCTPFLWNPANGDLTPTPPPPPADGETHANLFCSGHAFLPDGRLLVAGGHRVDSNGLNQAAIYDPAANTWTPTAVMNNGLVVPDSHRPAVREASWCCRAVTFPLTRTRASTM